MKLTEFFQTVEPRITGGCQYGWDCFGYNAYVLDIVDEISVVFDTKTQDVYAIYYYSYPDDDITQEVVWLETGYMDQYMALVEKHHSENDAEPQFISLSEMLSNAKEIVNQGE